MKKPEDKNNEKIRYIDYSCKNDETLLLVANLLVQTGKALESDDVRRIGDLIRDYMNEKILIDHYFWGRSLRLCSYSDSEIKLRGRVLRSGIHL